MSKRTLDLSLYFILGPSHIDGDPTAMIHSAISGGVTLLQLRDKRPNTADQIAYAKTVKQALAGTAVPLLINDRVDVALAIGADGVHLGRTDMDPVTARRLLGSEAVIGVTIKTEAEAAAVDARIVDYGSIGGVFPTDSKQNADPPIGLDGLRHRVRRIKSVAPTLPICAIAGIDASRTESVIAAGVDGVCVISAITRAADPKVCAEQLAGLVRSAKHSQIDKKEARR